MSSSATRPIAALILTNILGGVGVASGVAVGALLVASLGGTAVAGLGQAMSVLGAAVAAVPLANLAARSGRRLALGVGYVIAALGAVGILAGATLGWLWLTLVGVTAFGFAQATNLQSRYAASDAAPRATRGRTMSIVVWATTIGSVVGPNLSESGAELGQRLGLNPLAGPYLFSLLAFALAALVVVAVYGRAGAAPAGSIPPAPDAPDAAAAPAPGPTTPVQPPAPGTATSAFGTVPAPASGTPVPASPYGASTSTPAYGEPPAPRPAPPPIPAPTLPPGVRPGALMALRWAMAHPVARFAVLLLVIAHAVMVGIMSMTPVHLGHEGEGLRIVGLVISLHILGMYALSPVFGWMADRAGPLRTALVGLIMLGASAALVFVGSASLAVVMAALILLGLGWSAATISASVLLAGVNAGALRVPLQGATDALMNYGGAVMALISGPLLAALGFGGLALVAGLLIIPAAAFGWIARRHRRAESVV